jgi:hypothetical protein
MIEHRSHNAKQTATPNATVCFNAWHTLAHSHRFARDTAAGGMSGSVHSIVFLAASDHAAWEWLVVLATLVV